MKNVKRTFSFNYLQTTRQFRISLFISKPLAFHFPSFRRVRFEFRILVNSLEIRSSRTHDIVQELVS